MSALYFAPPPLSTSIVSDDSVVVTASSTLNPVTCVSAPLNGIGLGVVTPSIAVVPVKLIVLLSVG